MSIVRGIVGGVLGAAGAAIALRVRTLSKEREEPITEVLADLPGILAEDVSRLGDAARGAIEDGRDAAQRARIDFDEQVAAPARRIEGNDG
ncbi:MAG: hypothetical protein KDC46_13360 [Thermoleophilia bacterium]|nr:hypothetical protein [Thermoleophilia bacterium]